VLFLLVFVHFRAIYQRRSRFYFFYSLYAYQCDRDKRWRVFGWGLFILNFWALLFTISHSIWPLSDLLLFSDSNPQFRKHFPKVSTLFSYYALITSSISAVLVFRRYIWADMQMLACYFQSYLCHVPVVFWFMEYTYDQKQVRGVFYMWILTLGIASFIFPFFWLFGDVAITNSNTIISYIWQFWRKNLSNTYALAISTRSFMRGKWYTRIYLVWQTSEMRSCVKSKWYLKWVEALREVISFLERWEEQRVSKTWVDWTMRTITLLSSFRS